MIEGTSQYYGRRADEQTALGRQAATRKVAVVHYELAYRYALLSSRTASASYPEPASV
jgi:hypothetical protein